MSAVSGCLLVAFNTERLVLSASMCCLTFQSIHAIKCLVSGSSFFLTILQRGEKNLSLFSFIINIVKWKIKKKKKKEAAARISVVIMVFVHLG